MERILPSPLEPYQVPDSCKKTTNGKEYIPVRMATRVLGLCLGTGYCRNCDCREIIETHGGAIQNGYIATDTLPEIRTKLEANYLTTKRLVCFEVANALNICTKNCGNCKCFERIIHTGVKYGIPMPESRIGSDSIFKLTLNQLHHMRSNIEE